MSLRFLFLLLVIALQSACGGLEPMPGDTFYRLKELNTGAVGEKVAPWTEQSLAVERFRANGIYKDRAIALLQDDGVSLNQSKYHYWNDSPEILLQERFVEHALKQGIAGTVTSDISSDAEYVVMGRILRFERTRIASATHAVTIGLDLAVRRARSGREILYQEQLNFTQTMDDGEMPSAINLFSVGLDQLFTQFIEKATLSLSGTHH